MPLQLGGVETKRRQVVVWDEKDLTQCLDAADKIEDLLKSGFTVSSKDVGEVTLTPPARDPNIGVFRILSQNGDDRVIWDRRDAGQVKEAFEKFRELLTKKGYTAYAATEDGKRGHKITAFDPGLEEVILGAGEAILVPKTAAG
jgi:predicted Rdx family selenoprotein